jgi:hypothetical protein
MATLLVVLVVLVGEEVMVRTGQHVMAWRPALKHQSETKARCLERVVTRFCYAAPGRTQAAMTAIPSALSALPHINIPSVPLTHCRHVFSHDFADAARRGA